MTSVTDLPPDSCFDDLASCFDELDEWAGNDGIYVGVIQLLKQVKELCESRAKKIEEENKRLKELKELYEGRAKGMEEELNKIEKLVGIKEGDIPKPNQVFNAVNKLKEENDKLKELVGSIKKETDKAK